MSGNEERTAKKHAIYALVKEIHYTFVGESVHRRRAVGSAMGGRLDYTISYDFHLTNGRQSRLIHHHLTPILLSDDGRIWLALCTVSLAATDEPGHIIMQKNGERSYFEYSTSRHKWEKKEGITLSETEREVLRLSAQGYTMNDIADRLCKSVDTIKACKRNLFAKMGVKNIAEALFHATNYQMI